MLKPRDKSDKATKQRIDKLRSSLVVKRITRLLMEQDYDYWADTTSTTTNGLQLVNKTRALIY